MNYDNFFLEDLPAKLKKLDRNSQPLWGKMSPADMLNHLRLAVRMSIEQEDVEVQTPADKLPGYKKFLMSEHPFPKNAEAPSQLILAQQAPASDLDDLKLQLMKALVEMQSYFEKNPAHSAVHPTFGRLNVTEWKHLHKKHILHHCSQFGLN